MSSEPVAHAGPGWRARLDLGFERRDRHTRLTHRRHEGPLLVQKALYPQSAEICQVCILHPPGGVASGDELRLDASVGPRAHALLTTPASGKFYRRGPGGVAHYQQMLRVQGGTLEWLPQENIFYPHAAADMRTVVSLAENSRFIGWELACLGLPARAIGLESGEVRTRFEVRRHDRPLLLERLMFDQIMQTARWGMAGHSTLGTAAFYPARRPDLDVANEVLSGHCEGMTVACTLVDELLICRGLAHRADQLRGVFVRLWRELRPRLLGHDAVAPRIWAT